MGTLKSIQQININTKQIVKYCGTIELPKFLGHSVELFAFDQINRNNSLELLASNIQVIDENVTIGEIDALIQDHDLIAHLEIAYKFYLYDDTRESNGLCNWIGPNRKDNLQLKLSKIKRQQFPLLNKLATKSLLKELHLPIPTEQFVNFKGQLFLPFNNNIDVSPLNSDCIYGYYYRLNELEQFAYSKFYLPGKLEWLARPNSMVEWILFDELSVVLEKLFAEKHSPMLWIKSPKGVIEKGFAVWW